METSNQNLKSKVAITSNVNEIEISLEPPRVIAIRGYSKRNKKWEERHLKITEKSKMALM